MVMAHDHPELAEQVADALRADIQAVDGRLTILDAMQLDIAQLKVNVDEIKTDIAQLKVNVDEIKTDIAETKSNVAEILRRLPILEG